MSVRVVVPEGAVPGSQIQHTTPDGNQLDLTVPEGVPPGSTMVLERDTATGAWSCSVEMAPSGSAAPSTPTAASSASRSISVRIPAGARPGDPLNHVTEDGRQLDLTVPDGVPPGSFLNLSQGDDGRWFCTGITEAESHAATVEVAGDSVTSVSIAIPEGMLPGSTLQHTTPDGRQLDLGIPDGVVPGMVMTLTLDPATSQWGCSIAAADSHLECADATPVASAANQGTSADYASSLPPAETGARMTIVVPEGAGPGTSLPLATPDGKTLDITVPDGVGPGSSLVFTQDVATGGWSCVAENVVAPADQTPKTGVDALKQQRREETRARGVAEPVIPHDPVIRDASAEMPPALQRCDSEDCEEFMCDTPPQSPQASAILNSKGHKVPLPEIPNTVPTISGVEHLDAEIVFGLLQQSACLLVDLRSDDRAAGLIDGAVHEPAIDSTGSVAFISKVPDLIRRWGEERLIVFTCQYSAHRAPQCANWYREQAHAQQRVAILSGGFRGWEAQGLPVKNAAATLAEAQAADHVANVLGTQIIQEAGMDLPGQTMSLDDSGRAAGAHAARLRNESASSAGDLDIRVLSSSTSPVHKRGESDEVFDGGMPEINSFVDPPVLDKDSLDRARAHSAVWDGADTGIGPVAQSHTRQPRPPADQALSSASEDEDINDIDEGSRASTVPSAAAAAAAAQQRTASSDTFGSAMWDMGSRLGLTDLFGMNKKAEPKVAPKADKNKNAKPASAPVLPHKPSPQAEFRARDEAPKQPVAPVSFGVGDSIEMLRPVKYKPYELQKGLRGKVLLINGDGHAWVAWADGRQKWLRKDQFPEASRLAEAPQAPQRMGSGVYDPATGSQQQPYVAPSMAVAPGSGIYGGPGSAMRQSSYTPPPVSMVDGQQPIRPQSNSYTPAPQMFNGQAQPYAQGPWVPMGSGNSMSIPVDGGSMAMGPPTGSMVAGQHGASMQMAPGGGYPGASMSMAPAQGSSVSMAPAGGSMVMAPNGQLHDFGIGAPSYQPLHTSAPSLIPQHQQQYQQQPPGPRPLDPSRIMKQDSQQKGLIGL